MVTVDVLDMAEAELCAAIVKLRRRVRILSAVVGLLVAVLGVSGKPARVDISDRTTRAKLLRAAERARKVLPKSAALRIIGISSSSYSAWVAAEQGCKLDDRAACPRSTPTQLTPEEVRVIQTTVTSDEYRDGPTGQLTVVAQRMGEVFASSSTCYRLVSDHAWRRPHAAFSGQTTDEMYFGRGEGIAAKLEAGRRVARERRLAVNRKAWCELCRLSSVLEAPGVAV